MRPRKSASDRSNDGGYPGTLYKLCKEEDVFIIPQFVTHYVGRQSDYVSPRKSKDSKMTEKFGSNTTTLNNPTNEDCLQCEFLKPPEVNVIYEIPEDKENPVAVICKNIYIEYSLIQAIGKSLKPYPTINTLKVENCCISKEIAESLALILAEEPGRRISDLSLDGNENVAQVLPLFISFPTGLKFLSLERCNLNDEDIKAIAKSLAYSDQSHHSLQVLSLAMNKIGDMGVFYLANALRTNRTLVSISLPGNQIGDKGAMNLIEILTKFKLTHEEVMEKRKRVFDEIHKRKNLFEKYLEEWKMKGEVESHTSKMSAKSLDKFGANVKKIRGIDGKIRCLSSRDKRGKAVQTKMNSGEKFRGKIRSGFEESQSALEPTPSELLAIAQQVDSEMSPDKHPFVNEIYTSDNAVFCYGCWSLSNINLAYNYLTEKSVEEFTKVLNYQTESFRPPKRGLFRLVLLPGNSINENSIEFQKLQSALILHNSKKEVFEMSDSVPVGSVSSARRMSSSTRKLKKR